jgi:hypothetical protein
MRNSHKKKAVKKRRNTRSRFHKKKEGGMIPQIQNCLIILFLAHDGVKVPNVWEAWKEATEAELNPETDLLLYKVHTPEAMKGEFERKYDLGLESKATSWCSPSLVSEYIRMLKKTLEVIPPDIENVLISLVSGTDIPILNGVQIFKDKLQESVCYTSRSRYKIAKDSHIQWLSLRKETAQDLIEKWETVDKPRVFRELVHTNDCFDNTFLIKLGVETKSICSHHAEVRNNSTSPIQWRSFDEPTLIYSNALKTIDSIYEHISPVLKMMVNLKILLLYMKIFSSQKNVFFRKVMYATDDDVDFLRSKIWKVEPDRKDPKYSHLSWSDRQEIVLKFVHDLDRYFDEEIDHFNVKFKTSLVFDRILLSEERIQDEEEDEGKARAESNWEKTEQSRNIIKSSKKSITDDMLQQANYDFKELADSLSR